MERQLAAELGPHGVRVTCMRPGGMPDSIELGSHARRIWGDAAQRLGTTLEEMLPAVGGGTVLGRPTSVRDLAEVAAFMASERGAGLTGTVANVSIGAVPD